MSNHTPHPGMTCGINPSHAWRCTKEGTPGAIVYCQNIALNFMAQHYDIEIGKIRRDPWGNYMRNENGVRIIDWGVI